MVFIEPFIKPSLFDPLDGSIVDEYTFGQNQDRGQAAAALRAHWDSWITRDDFFQIASAGLSECHTVSHPEPPSRTLLTAAVRV